MPRTVVIVDDHPSFRASARAVLQSEGFDVVGEAEDGAGAIDAVSVLQPDVLLLDVQLPAAFHPRPPTGSLTSTTKRA